jgi:outer membrane receptor protein involved in Fe transport
MANFEGFRLHNQTQGVYDVPSVAMRTGDFSQILPGTPISDPLNNNQPFTANRIPTMRLDSISLKMLEFHPAPNQPGSALVRNYLTLDNNITNKDQFTSRVDFVENAKSNWFGRVSWDDEYILNPALYLNGHFTATTAHQGLIDNTRILRPNLVNEFRFGVNHFFNDIGGELVSWTRGTHAVRFGADIRRDRYSQIGNQFPRDAAGFQNQATGYGFADYMLGYLYNNSDAAGLANTQLRATSQAYYVTDAWKVRPNLTVNVGLRYEFVPPWSNRRPNLLNTYVPLNAPVANITDPKLQPIFVRPGTGDFYQDMPIRFNPNLPVQRSDTLLGSRLVGASYTNFAPRLGIAWSPSQKWTVRSKGPIRE